MGQESEKHFLVVAYSMQGHINPSRQLAHRLARTTGALVTFSTTVSGQRRLFPSSLCSTDQEIEDGGILYIPYADGEENDAAQRESLSDVIRRLAARGRPVTCVIYALILNWVTDVAHEHGIPAVLYWIQAASTFYAYYHYFHGFESHVAGLMEADSNHAVITLPCSPPLELRDLPTFLTSTADGPDAPINIKVRELFRSLFKILDREISSENNKKPMILANTFPSLECEIIKLVDQYDIFPIGPMVPNHSVEEGKRLHLFEPDEEKYLDWMSSKPAKSVVYVSFGSYLTVKPAQIEELKIGLEAAGRPYLWLVRKDNRSSEEFEKAMQQQSDVGMVVAWCDQMKVLSHPAIGCFVTHCGWNSTLESLSCGVPIIGVPQWSDQTTSARMAVNWGVGVRAAVDDNGVMRREELVRCVESVMGDGGKFRENAEFWKEKSREATSSGGSSEKNLNAFVNSFVV